MWVECSTRHNALSQMLCNTGVRFEVVGANGEVAAQMSTTSDSGAKAEVELGRSRPSRR